MKTKEVRATELKVGDTVVAKQGRKRYKVVGVSAGFGGRRCPYLLLKPTRGEQVGHDTTWDSNSATYTVLVGQQ